MPGTLDKATLKTAIKNAFKDEMPGTPTADQIAAYDRIAGKISDAIDVYVKGGTVTVTVPFPIPVTVDPTSHIGGTTATADATGTIE